MTARYSFPWAIWLTVLFCESELVAVTNYTIRTHLRDLLHFPLYHLFFATLACAMFFRTLTRSAWPPFPRVSFNIPLGVSHVLCWGIVSLSLRPLYQHLLGQPAAVQVLVWGAVLLLFAGTWLGTLLPVSTWIPELRRQAPWLTISGTLGALSLGVIHASNWLWEPLAGGTLSFSSKLLSLLYDDVVCSQSELRLGTSTFSVLIEPGCSGYEGIGLISLFTLTYLWMRRQELVFPEALVLLPAGIVFNWGLNIARITALIVLGTSINPELARNSFHSQAGWLAFTATSMLMLVTVEQFGLFQLRPNRPSAPVEPEESEYPGVPYLLPLLVLLFCSMLAQALTPGFDWSYPVRILLSAVVLATYPAGLRRLKRPKVALSVAVGLLIYALWYLLTTPLPTPAAWTAGPYGWVAAWLVCRVVGSCLVIPLVEELAFRGYVLPLMQESVAKLSSQAAWTLAALGSSLCFAFLHTELLAAFLAGLGYAWAARRGGLSSAVTAHAVTNLCIAAEVLWFDHWGLW